MARAVTPGPAWRVLQRLNRWRKDAPHRVLRRQGWEAIRKDDYYSPLPVKENLLRNRARWNKPSSLAGIAIDQDRMLAEWTRLHRTFASEYGALPDHRSLASAGFGVGFPKADARTLYYMLRDKRPRRYVEVGAGLSTYYAHLARAATRADGGPDMSMTCIDPYPHAALSTIPGIEVIRDEVQDLPTQAFESLDAGDVLFIDSSHAAKIDSDVTFLMTEVVPRVRTGVYIHIHDIPFPYNFPYPPELYIFDREWPMYWNEPVVVQAFLQFNDSFEVVLSLPYLAFRDPELVARTVPERGPEISYANVIGSLWLRRVR